MPRKKKEPAIIISAFVGFGPDWPALEVKVGVKTRLLGEIISKHGIEGAYEPAEDEILKIIATHLNETMDIQVDTEELTEAIKYADYER